MTRFWRNSLVTVVAMLCLGLIVSGTGLKLPAFSRGGGAIAEEQRAPVTAIDPGDRETLPTARGDREGLIETDKSWYEPGEVIVVTGSGFDAGEVVTLLLHEDPTIHSDRKVSIVADAFGNIFDNQFVREGAGKGITFYLTARGESSGLTTQRVLANPSADLDQCANGSAASPDSTPCQSANEWVNGNLGGSKAHYNEGDSVPYRLRFGSLPLTSHTVVIEWDTTKSDKHALDYLTTFNRTVGPDANPCIGVSGCTLASFNPYSITADSQVTGAGVTPTAGEFRLWGGTITALSTYSYPNGTGFSGDKSARISITFTPTVSNPVLAWGGHISTRIDWGTGNSCVAISGSPFHTRLIDLDGAGGNQDRSLSSDAVTFPGSITIIKDAVPNDAQDFSFSTTGGLLPAPATFSLDDDNDATLTNTKLVSNITNFTTYTVTEGAATNWTLSFGNPVCTVTSANGGSQSGNVGTRTVTINLKEGEIVTCTFTNTAVAPKLTVTKIVVNDNGGTKVVSDFPLFVDSTSVTSGVQNSFSTGAHTVSETADSGYTETIGGDCAADGSITLGIGDVKACTITNDDKGPKLKVTKIVVNDNGGSKKVSDFPLFVDSTSVTSGVQNSFNAGAHTVSETPDSGYTETIGGDCAANGSITLGLGDVKECTITNDDGKASPTIATDMSWTLEDKAVFTGVVTGGICNAPAAPVTFNLYGPFDPLSFDDSASSNCTGTPVFTSTAMSIANAAGTGASHPVTVQGIYVWQVIYLGDDCNNGRTTACNSEITEVKEANSIPTP